MESGYHQILIKPAQRKLLGIKWSKNGKTRHLVWRTLFLGVRSAVHIFTKILKPSIAYCNDLGIVILFYIDDMRCVAKSFEECERFFHAAMSFLVKSGWQIKAGKGIWIPTQRGEFLGLIHDMVKMFYYVPEKKMELILEAGKWLLSQKKVKV
jgi:hypothetical protein